MLKSLRRVTGFSEASPPTHRLLNAVFCLLKEVGHGWKQLERTGYCLLRQPRVRIRGGFGRYPRSGTGQPDQPPPRLPGLEHLLSRTDRTESQLAVCRMSIAVRRHVVWYLRPRKLRSSAVPSTRGTRESPRRVYASQSQSGLSRTAKWFRDPGQDK